MAENSKIEWTHHTMNFWVGCTKLTPACDFCYAESWAKRTGHPELWQGERRRTSENLWKQPYKWNRLCAETGERARVFTNSLADFFDNQVPSLWRSDAYHVILETPNLDWMILSKRPENGPKMLPPVWGDGWNNVWIGATVEDRPRKKRIDALRRIPARVRFLSIEPLLEDLGELDLTGIHLVIVGGESGPNARPMHPDWARSIRDQCAAQGVPFFFKQWGEWAPGECADFAPKRTERTAEWFDGRWLYGSVTPHVSEEMHRDDEPDLYCIGKKHAGRYLDGRTHDAMPTRAAA